jgi:hypothetical protein
MATSNVTVTTSWVKLADGADTNTTVQCNRDDATYEIASVATETAPTVIGVRIRGRKIVNREQFGAGFVYAKLIDGSASTSFIVTTDVDLDDSILRQRDGSPITQRDGEYLYVGT